MKVPVWPVVLMPAKNSAGGPFAMTLPETGYLIPQVSQKWLSCPRCWRRGSSQDEGAGVAGCINAGEEERSDLWEHKVVGQRAPGPGAACLEQQVRKAALLWRVRLDVLQQLPHDALRATPNRSSATVR